MRVFRLVLGFALPLIMWQAASAFPQRMSYSETKKTIERIKIQSDRFKDNFDHDVDRAGVDSGTRHSMERTVERFEEAAEHLKGNYHKDNAAVPNVTELLSEAAVIDSFISQHVVSPRVQSEWLLLRQDLDLLANSYGINAGWPSALARVEIAPPAAVVVIPAQPGTIQMQDLIRDLDTHAAAFQSNVTSALAAGLAETGSPINQYVGDFMVAVDRFKRGYPASYSNMDAVNELLSRGEEVDQYMASHPLSASAQQSWVQLRNDLTRLAAAYSLSPAWLTR